MNALQTDTAFAGSIPKLYQTLFVPLIFEPYAAHLAGRLVAIAPTRVLEIAAGTGVVTRRMASQLPESTAIVATDLNQAMLDEAAAVGTARPVQWRQADAMQLPFADASFDAVVCQFGAMFFPDKGKAYAEARRVLVPGGVFLFDVWDRIEDNEIADLVTATLGSMFPDDPPRFMARVPHGYHDLATIREDLRKGGFEAEAEMATITERSGAADAHVAATAYCCGTPLRSEIETRDKTKLEAATDLVERALIARFGHDAFDSKIQAHVISVVK
jgi:ubiquinone/menaquinone biosynthesis C-methylase UbiE